MKAIQRRQFLTTAASLTTLSLSGAFGTASARKVSDTPVAVTEYGRVRGFSAREVLCFCGIPYAGPTDTERRFKPPAQPQAWTGVRDASNPGPRAWQSSPRTVFGNPIIGNYFSGGRSDAITLAHEVDDENCLVLNVLTPALHGKRPVMVYIHGGSFDSHSGALVLLADKFVAEQDVVVVGINHRLSVFGYTYLGNLDTGYADSGNVGQLDLIAALRWVQNNIDHFGGDPSNVTLFGESGGGWKISTLLATPAAKGLFHRAIIGSGSALQVRTREEAMEDTHRLLAYLGGSAGLEQLQTLPASELLAAYTAAIPGRASPVVDGRSIPRQTWKPDAPPEAAGIPLIIGCCKDETTLFELDDKEVFSLDWSSLTAREIKAGIPADCLQTILTRYRADYPTDSPSDLYFRIATDRGFRSAAVAQAEAKCTQHNGDVYMYYFTWNTGLGDGRLRAFHTADWPLSMRLVANPASEHLSRQIAASWAAFARHGDPNHPGIPHWEKYSIEQRQTLFLDADQVTLVAHPDLGELALLAPYS